jgi:SAM-dependent methyltransferase
MKELRREAWHWNRMASEDPMFYILTDPAKQGHGWNETEFFETGRRDVASSIERLQREVGVPLRSGSALDFGCGIGRLTQALAERFERVHGIDISAAMVEQASAKNRFGPRVAYHTNTSDQLPMLADGSIDFIFSRLVLQHIPRAAARSYMAEFSRVLAPGGVAMFQLMTGARSAGVRLRHFVRERAPDLYRSLRDLVLRRPRFELNVLSEGEVRGAIERNGVTLIAVLSDEDHDPEFDSRWMVAHKADASER